MTLRFNSPHTGAQGASHSQRSPTWMARKGQALAQLCRHVGTDGCRTAGWAFLNGQQKKRECAIEFSWLSPQPTPSRPPCVHCQARFCGAGEGSISSHPPAASPRSPPSLIRSRQF